MDHTVPSALDRVGFGRGEPRAAVAGVPRQRLRRRESISRRALGIADVLAVSAALLVGVLVAGDGRPTVAALAIPPLFVVLAKALGLYDRDEHVLRKRTLDEAPGLLALATAGALLVSLSGHLLVAGGIGRDAVLAVWGVLLAMLVAFRSAARFLVRRAGPVERCLFVGGEAIAEELGRRLGESAGVNAELVGFLRIDRELGAAPAGEVADRLRWAAEERGVDRVILGAAEGRSEELLDSIRRVGIRRLRVSVLEDAGRAADATVEIDRLSGITLLGMRRFEMTRSSLILKRCFDLVGSSVALAVGVPALAAIAIVIKLDSPGPVLFRQRRVGRHGEPFRMLKFRTMVVGADELKEGLRHLNEADGVFKIADDPRITRAGRLLRRLHVDEIPQLVNVLRGEMSLVGPRPLPLDEDGRLEGWHRRRLDLRPGITGVWQVLGSSRVPVREMVRMDYRYVASWSLWNDIRILLMTVPQVVRRGGL